MWDENEAIELEKELHKQFEHRRTKGEWFRFDFSSDSDKEEFKTLCKTAFLLSMKYGQDRWWSVISVEAFDEDLRNQRSIMFSTAAGRRSVLNARIRSERDRKSRKAWKELDRYGHRP